MEKLEGEAKAQAAPETSSSKHSPSSSPPVSRSPSPPLPEPREKEITIRCSHIKRSTTTEGIQASFHVVSSSVAPYVFQNAIPLTPADIMLHPILLESVNKEGAKTLAVVWQRTDRFQIHLEALNQDSAAFCVSVSPIPSGAVSALLSELSLPEEELEQVLNFQEAQIMRIVVYFPSSHVLLMRTERIDTPNFVGIKGVLS